MDRVRRMSGTSDLFSAARKGNIEQFDKAVVSGENIESVNNHGQSVVHVIGACGQFSLLEHLVERYPSALCLGRKLDHGGYNAVHRCCRMAHTDGRLRTLDLLLRTTGIRVDTQCQGVTVMDMARQYKFNDIKAYMRWIRYHPEGLPESVRRQNNETVLRFLRLQPQLHADYEEPRTFPVPVPSLITGTTCKDELPSEELNTYLEMFDGQTEKYRHIRVMFVGKESAGKTTLCNRLQGKPVDIAVREPTEGASLYLQIFEVDLDRKTWTRVDDVISDDIIADRMGRLIRNERKRRSLNLDNKKLSVAPEVSGYTIDSSNVDKTPVASKPLSEGILATVSKSPFKMSMPDVRQLHQEHLRFADVVYRRSELPSGDNVALLSMWDMGGQEAFQANHGVFMSSHCVYILAFDMLEYLTERDESGRIVEWIRTIGSYRSSYDKPRPSRKPPIIIVGTKMDLVKHHIPAEKDRKKRIDAIKEELCRSQEVGTSEDTEKTVDFIRFCTVDNANANDSSYMEIKNLVLEAAKHQDQWEREIPVNWLSLERDMLKQRTKGRRILTLQEIYEIDAKCESPIADKEHIQLFLEYLHRNRTIIFFRGHDQAVIDPQWLSDAFRRLITDSWFIDRDLVLRRNLRDYQSLARLTLSLIKELWTRDQSEGFHQHMEILLVFMEKFGLLVRPIDGFDCRGEAIFAKHYFVPSKLNDPSTSTWIDEQLRNATFVSKTLCIMFKEVFIPRDVFDRIQAGCLQQYQLKDCFDVSVEHSTLLRGLACFQIEGVWNLIVSLQWNQSAIGLTLYSLTEHTIYLNIGQRLLQEIKRIIDSVLQTKGQDHLSYRDHLHCSYKLGPRDDPLSVEEVLMSRSAHPCRGDKCKRKHQLRRDHLSVWIPVARTAPSLENYIRDHSHGGPTEGRRLYTRSRFRILRRFFRFILEFRRQRSRRHMAPDPSEETDRLGIPHRMPTAREFGRLSELVGEWYAMMFVDLGMEIQAIEQIRSGCSQLSFRSQITKMFLHWSNQFPEQTFAHIAEAMSMHGKSEDDIFKIIDRRWDVYGKVRGIELKEKTLNREPTEQEIRYFAIIMDKSYFNLCLELGLNVYEIDQVDIEYQKVKDKMAKLLKRWVKGCKERATIRRILLAMERCNMDVAIISTMGLS